ncbi:hypothetical protein BGX23_004274 [Mortierella sp. AD031]|nr:hypothetical protein BGX23_004274 [Mortierella sp. AD031]
MINSRRPVFNLRYRALPLSQMSTNTPIARIVAPAGQWKTLAPKQEVKGKGTKQPDVKGERQKFTRFRRRPEIEALVDWVLTPGSYESLRVDNAKKAGRMVNDVYGDVARPSEVSNLYEMLSIFPTPLLSKPINKTTAHSTGPTASAEAGKAEVIDIELSDDEVDNPRLTPMNAATEESDRSSSNRSSGSIILTQNLSSIVGSLIQALGSFSGDGAGASSSGRDYFMNRIE